MYCREVDGAERGTAATAAAIQLDDTQRVALERALDTTRRIVAVTGPAGSGKTTLIRHAYGALRNAGYNPAVAAPTGKAARRIHEATGAPAQTLHMLLEYTAPGEVNPKTGKPYGDTYPRRTRERPLEHDTVLVDEYAMVNHTLHRNLIDALPPGARVVMFGDASQLPPIESSRLLAAKPTVFSVALQKFDGVHLSTVHRQTDGSGILSNAQRVLRGLAPQSNTDFGMQITDKPVDILRTFDLMPFKQLDNQIITPIKKSWIGTHALNQLVQSIVWPEQREVVNLPRHQWEKTHPVAVGVGDKVVMNKNWYDLEATNGTRGVFNGEVGIVVDLTDMDEVVVDFDGRVVLVPPVVQLVFNNRVVLGAPQKDLSLAYALTTHKCQGSEYQHVIYVINKSAHVMLNRRNLYTAITRARKRVDMLTDMRGLSVSVSVKEPVSFGD